MTQTQLRYRKYEGDTINVVKIHFKRVQRKHALSYFLQSMQSSNNDK